MRKKDDEYVKFTTNSNTKLLAKILKFKKLIKAAKMTNKELK